jgi:ADP-heptose:LPS heptosyltransferase
MTTKKRKKRLNAVQSLLKDIGADSPGSINTSDKAVMADIAAHLKGGVDAMHKLRQISSYDADKDIKSMGSFNMDSVDTVEEFKSTARWFLLVKSIAEGQFRNMMFDMNVEEGAEYCMTPTVFKQMNASRVMFRPADRKFNDEYTPYDGQDLNGKTLFMWRTGGIGDILFIRPIICHLKKLYDCKIIFATRNLYHSMVNQWPEIDELHDIPFKADLIDRSDYQLTFEGLIERCADAERMDVHDLFAKYAGLDPDEIEWCQPMTIATKTQWLLDSVPEKYVVMQVRSSSPVRTPRINTFIQAADHCAELGYKVIMVDSPRGARLIDDLISCCKHKKSMINFTRHSGQLADTVKLLDNAALVIGPDSSMVHLAAMQDVHGLGIYGPFPGRCRLLRYPKCKWVETPKSTICTEGGRECFCHAHLRCEYNERCWDLLDNDVLCSTISEMLNV